eukprot:403350489
MTYPQPSQKTCCKASPVLNANAPQRSRLSKLDNRGTRNICNYQSIKSPILIIINSASPFFKSNNKKRVKKRKDQFGVRIVKGQKNHKISFIDDVMDYKLAEINIVESYKEYYRYDNNRETEVACKFCSIY